MPIPAGALALLNKKEKDKPQPGTLQTGAHAGISPRHSPSSPSRRRLPAASAAGGASSSGPSSTSGVPPQSPSHSSAAAASSRHRGGRQHHHQQEPPASPQRHTASSVDPPSGGGGFEDGHVASSQTKRNRQTGVACSGENSTKPYTKSATSSPGSEKERSACTNCVLE